MIAWIGRKSPTFRILLEPSCVHHPMRLERKTILRHCLGALLLLVTWDAHGQCPQAFDFFGAAVDEPYWYSCSGGDFTFNLQSPDNWTGVEVDWGDGSPVTTQSPWNSPDILTHIYPATVDTFVVTLTEPSSGCVVEGVVVMEEATSASIQIPVGGLTQACAPATLEFINSSTNVSQTTTFIWDFGDGSPQLTFDYTNWQQTVDHQYEPQTVDCETQVTLSAENYCNTIQGGASEATFSPIRIWDVDEAAITASATVLCYPDTTVEFANTTERNCLFQGNIAQRYEWWNFGDYWGTGQDSIIDWTPWPPTFPYEIAYPGIGTYEVQMLDSNFCGIDTANITIQIVEPPIAGISASASEACVGDPLTFFQGATGGGNEFSWNFGDGVGWLPTGSGNITYVYNAPGTYEVCTAVGIAGASQACADTACVEVTILPGPIADIVADGLLGCDNLTVDFSDNSQGAAQWDWTFDVDPFTFEGDDPPPIDYDTPGTYVVNLTVTSSNGCLDNDQELIEVFSSPIPDILASNVCEGEEGTFIDLSVSDPGDPILAWEWDFGDGSPTSSFQNPSHTYPATGSYTVTLTVLTANCSATGTFQVDVEPSPSPSFTLNPTTGCAPLSVQFENTSTGEDNVIWDFGDGEGSVEDNPTHVFQHFGTADTTFTVVMTAQTAFGCGATDTAEVFIQPGAVAGFNDNSQPPSCSPFQAFFENTSQGASGYLWDFGDGSPTTDETSPSHLYDNNTGFVQTYTVTLIAYAPNGCNDTLQSNVTVYPLANWEIELVPDSGCSPLIVTMPFVPGASVFEWDFGDGSPVSNLPTPTHIYENTTLSALFHTVQFVGTSPFGCVDTATTTVQVNPQPVANFTMDVSEGCSPLEVTFTNNSVQATDYMWVYAPGDTSFVADPTHTHTVVNLGPGLSLFDVELHASTPDGCSSLFTQPLQVFPQAIPSFENPGPACSPLSVELVNTSQNADVFSWDLGNGITSGLAQPNLVLTNNSASDTSYVICLDAENAFGCNGSICENVVVQPAPLAGFQMDASSACDPAPVTFTNTSSGAFDYLWDYGNGDTDNTADPIHTYLFDGEFAIPVEYTISLTATAANGCSDSFDAIFTLNPEIIAQGFVDGGDCSPAIVDFQNASLGDSGGIDWDFGDGATTSVQDPVHTYIHSGDSDTTFVATLVAESVYGCTDTAFFPITVHPTPLANIAVDSIAGCYPLEVFFVNNSAGDGTFEWVYGTGETAVVPDSIHSYTYYNLADEPVTYNVTMNMVTEFGCTSSDNLSVEVYPLLEADFSPPDEGCSPLQVSFENTSQGALSYSWDFGDGGTSGVSEPTHTFFNATVEDVVYEVMLVAQSAFGCFDTIFQDVTVFATPHADFSVNPTTMTFPESTIDILDNSVAGSAAEYIWNMGDGSFLQNNGLTNYTYDSWGTFDILLTIANSGCQDTAMRTIEIIAPLPEALFDVQEMGCAPLTVQFENLSQFNATSLWDFGDGSGTTIDDPVYTYTTPGTYDVSLTVTGFTAGQQDVFIIEDAVTVLAPAVAAFTYTPDQLEVPGQPMYTVNLSQNATDFFWDFGDGTSSAEFSPTHYYQNPGVYSITLIANNAANCPDTLVIPAAINAIAGGELVFPNAFTPSTTIPANGIYDPEAFDNDVFHPRHSGVETYELQIFNKWGELLFRTENVWEGWNGYYREELCKEDVYVWKAKARFANGTETVQSGDVTLLVR